MSWIHSLLITSVLAAGIAVVVWLVSMITGETDYMMTGVLIVVFIVVWFWIHRGMKDPDI